MTSEKKTASVDGNKNPLPAFDWEDAREERPTLRQRFSDAVTAGMGSWKFIIGQTVILAAWITLNTTTVVPIPHWDPNLFLLNLALSCEAAFAGAFILMSQNRRSEKDRQMAQNDYYVDLSSERTINDMNRKLDILLATLPPEQLKEMLRQGAESRESSKASTNDNVAVAPKPAAKPGLG